MIHNSIIVDNDIKSGIRLKQLIEKVNSNINIISIEINVVGAIKNIMYHKPDVLFINIEMPQYTGFELIEIIRKKGQNPLVVVVDSNNQYAIRALKKSVFDYLLKPYDLDELKDSLHRIESTLDNSHKKLNIPENFKLKLSEREIQIIEGLFSGKSSKDIAIDLNISKSTVDTHRRNILKKTGFKSTSEMICGGH